MTLYWVKNDVVRLAIMPRPRGGDWLSNDLRLLRQQGVDAIVSALTPEENEELFLAVESLECRKNDLDFISFSIEDRSVPTSAAAFSRLIRKLQELVSASKTMAIHCRAGIGRSSLIAACLLTRFGLSSDHAFHIIEEARGCPVPDTPEQRTWVERFSANPIQKSRASRL